METETIVALLLGLTAGMVIGRLLTPRNGPA